MSLTKQTVTEKIEIVGQFNTLQIRQAIQVLENDNVISQSYHRYVLQPDADLTSQDDKIVAVANAVWTDQVKADYAAHLAAQAESV